jgi:hypothetical protein
MKKENKKTSTYADVLAVGAQAWLDIRNPKDTKTSELLLKTFMAGFGLVYGFEHGMSKKTLDDFTKIQIEAMEKMGWELKNKKA